MNKKFIYKPTLENIDSFITYKFALMPEKVINREYIKESYRYLFMNNEFLKLLINNINKNDLNPNFNLDMLMTIKNLIKESLDFYENYSTRCQKYSKFYKNKKTTDIKPKYKNEILYISKYICFKEAYDLELDINKIKNYDATTAKEILERINTIISPHFTLENSSNLRDTIISRLKEEEKQNENSNTLAIHPVIIHQNPQYFRALVCSNQILKHIKILEEKQKLSKDSLDLCIQLLNYSISAKNNTLSHNKRILIDDDEINSFNKEEAIKLQNKLICLKYKKAYGN